MRRAGQPVSGGHRIQVTKCYLVRGNVLSRQAYREVERRLLTNRRVVALVTATAILAGCSSGAHVRKAERSSAEAARPSPDPYIASLRYANCMRAHGVPHPLPDKRGDFHLTKADERRMRRVPRSVRKAADDACFHHLKGLNLSPLSKQAIARANKVVASLGRCIRRAGYRVGPPQVRNLGRGRASFGFAPLPGNPGYSRAYLERFTRASHACEKRMHFAQ